MAEAADPLFVRAVRLGLRISPPPLREHIAAQLFSRPFQHDEPERERLRRETGEPLRIGAGAGTSFGAEEAPVALLMHGWEGRGLQLMAYIDPLVEAGYRVIAIDGQGHGQAPAGRAGFAPFAEVLQAAMREHDVRAIVAHSAGSLAAILATRRERFAGKVLLLAGPPDTEHVLQRARDYMRLPDSGWTRFIATLSRMYDGVRLDDVWDIHGAAAEAARHGARFHALLAAGDDDVPVDESRSIMQAAGAEAVVMEGPGHRSIMWHPDAVAAGLAFLLD